MNLLKTSISTLVDLLYPRQCQICGEVETCRRFSFLCDGCFDSAPRLNPPYCERCALPLPGAFSAPFRCPNCSEMSLHFSRAMAPLRFQGVVRRVIHAFKYSHQRYWSQVLSSWLVDEAKSWNLSAEVDVVVPVPLFATRERERGFNQAKLLTEDFVKAVRIPCEPRALVRVRETETQTHLDRAERLENLRNAFQVRNADSIEGKRVLLMDDVLTTGSTANECARVLQEAGATSVLVFTLARG
jgi:competence protein ComFC